MSRHYKVVVFSIASIVIAAIVLLFTNSRKSQETIGTGYVYQALRAYYGSYSMYPATLDDPVFQQEYGRHKVNIERDKLLKNRYVIYSSLCPVKKAFIYTHNNQQSFMIQELGFVK